MPSEKLTRALRSKTTLSDAEIASLNESEGWRALYEIARSTRDRRDQICFTGFGKVEYDELEKDAAETGWLKVVGSVTTKLAFLCTGDTPGPAKVGKAEKLGAIFINRDEFRVLINDGVVPRV
jgi:NAD-dependent DNA ligase